MIKQTNEISIKLALSLFQTSFVVCLGASVDSSGLAPASLVVLSLVDVWLPESPMRFDPVGWVGDFVTLNRNW